ncbi:MAG: TVP38/TMEM64 family protein [Candidatus Contendobacter sp.]
MIRNPWVWLLLAGLLGALLVLDPGRYFSLDLLKSQYAALMAYRLEHPRIAALLYFGLYVTVAGLSVPGIIMLSVAGGAVFGLFWGTVLASFASTLGGTLAFLTVRRALRDRVRRRWDKRLRAVEAGMARDGPFYLFGLRLIPVIPYFLINLLMALTQISPWTFCWISQLGMLPLLIVYVNAGTQLARLNSLQDMLSPALLFSLALLAVFPLLARGFVALIFGQRQSSGANLGHSRIE